MITKEERENLTMLTADIEELVSGGTSEQTAKIVAGRNYIEYLHDTIDDMEAEIERLKGDKKAIGSKLYDSKQTIKKQSKEKKRLLEVKAEQQKKIELLKLWNVNPLLKVKLSRQAEEIEILNARNRELQIRVDEYADISIDSAKEIERLRRMVKKQHEINNTYYGGCTCPLSSNKGNWGE